jgi:hypothetical protein
MPLIIKLGSGTKCPECSVVDLELLPTLGPKHPILASALNRQDFDMSGGSRN